MGVGLKSGALDSLRGGASGSILDINASEASIADSN